MSNTDTTIDIDAASEGMILAHNLLDSGGAVLLPEGASLSASSLASLRRRGIEQLQVRVEAGPSAADLAVAQAERERRCQRLQHLFRSSAAVGASARLLEHLTAYRKGE
ncbi:MAG: hypothetical protein WKG03_14100 [Telluria sp.]